MIHNQWYVVLESKEIQKKPVGVTRMGEKLVFWRNEAGNIHCAVDRCPHRGVALSIGKLENDIYNAHSTALSMTRVGVVSTSPPMDRVDVFRNL